MEKVDNRKKPVLTETEMYKISDIDSFIKNERREAEKAKLTEVKQQKKTWLKTFLFCLFLNLGFLACGIAGLYINK